MALGLRRQEKKKHVIRDNNLAHSTAINKKEESNLMITILQIIFKNQNPEEQYNAETIKCYYFNDAVALFILQELEAVAILVNWCKMVEQIIIYLITKCFILRLICSMTGSFLIYFLYLKFTKIQYKIINNLYILLQLSQMVDRYKSLLGSESRSQIQEVMKRSIKANDTTDFNRMLVEKANTHPTKLRQIITKYKRDPGRNSEELINQFYEEQRKFIFDRNQLSNELIRIENKKKNDPMAQFMKRQLLKAVKNEIELELELNQIITKRKEQKQQLVKRLGVSSTSEKVKNAVADILQKKKQIQQLQRSIKQCLDLLQLIGVFTKQQGQNIDRIQQLVKQANINIQRAQQNIQKALIQQQKSNCKRCFIIILCLVIIAIAVGAYLGVRGI